MGEMLVCNKCQVERSECEFSVHRRYRSGRYPTCKDCMGQNGTVTCVRCGEEREASFFPRDAHVKRGVRRICRECENAYRRERYKVTAVASSKQRWYEEKARFQRIAKVAGISLDEAKAVIGALIMAQEGKCAICGDGGDAPLRLDMDHDHQSGRIRGLLCRKCNTAIGLLKEDPEILRKAADYLE